MLELDEVIQVQSANGTKLLEIVQDVQGPVVRLLSNETRLELPGKLCITAASLELRASNGSARIEASDEVQLASEIIHLN